MKGKMISPVSIRMLKWILLSAVVFAVMFPPLCRKCLAANYNTTYSVTTTYSITATDDEIFDNSVMTVPAGYTYVSTDDYRSVKVDSGYLALRTDKSFEKCNEIGELYTGDMVEVLDDSDFVYWYVYAPTLGKYGYVNKNYLYTQIYETTPCITWTVKVDSGYLALRNEKAFEKGNEIGELYTGDDVEVLDDSDFDYWYVYSPRLEKYGYVNCDYLY